MMNLRSRLARLERETEDLRRAPVRCPDCAAPVPAMPMMLFLEKDGTLLMDQREPCSTCGTPPGTQIPVDPGTGEPERPPSVISLDISFEAWVEKHRASGASYPEFWQNALEWVLARSAREGADPARSHH